MARDFSLVVVKVTVIVALAGSALAQSDSCQACNCQFNNVEVLNQVIEASVRDMLADEAGT